MPIRPLARQGVSDPLLSRKKCRDNNKGCGIQYWYDYYVDPSIAGPQPVVDPTPVVLDDATIWLDSRSPGFAYADSDRMTSGWNDTSGNGLHFDTDYGAGTYGLYKTDYVDFDSSNTKIGRTAVPFTDFMGLNTGTFVFLMRQSGTTNATITHRPGDSGNKVLFHMAFTDNNFYIDWGNQFSGGRVSFTEPGDWDDGLFHTVIIRRTVNALLVWIDGVEVYSNAAAYSSARTNTTDNLDLGGVNGSGWQLAQFMTWDRALTNDEMIALEAFLQSIKP